MECQSMRGSLEEANVVTSISKWGNSCGIRIPKRFLDELGLITGDRLEVCVVDDTLVIRKVQQHKKYKDLKERIEDFYKCSYDEVVVSETEEIKW